MCLYIAFSHATMSIRNMHVHTHTHILHKCAKVILTERNYPFFQVEKWIISDEASVCKPGNSLVYKPLSRTVYMGCSRAGVRMCV